MKRHRTIHTKEQKALVLSKQLLTIKDIGILYDCGFKRAKYLAGEFHRMFSERVGYSLYADQIPTKVFIDFMGFDESRVRSDISCTDKTIY